MGFLHLADLTKHLQKRQNGSGLFQESQNHRMIWLGRDPKTMFQPRDTCCWPGCSGAVTHTLAAPSHGDRVQQLSPRGMAGLGMDTRVWMSTSLSRCSRDSAWPLCASHTTEVNRNSFCIICCRCFSFLKVSWHKIPMIRQLPTGIMEKPAFPSGCMQDCRNYGCVI